MLARKRAAKKLQIGSICKEGEQVSNFFHKLLITEKSNKTLGYEIIRKFVNVHRQKGPDCTEGNSTNMP